MIRIRPATKDEVVLAWLQAELRSPRFGANYTPYLDDVSTNQLINNADLSNATDNERRLAILSEARNASFVRKIEGKTWSLVGLEKQELSELLYPSEDWRYLSESLRFGDGVCNLKNPPSDVLKNPKFPKDNKTAFQVARCYDCYEPVIEPIVIGNGQAIVLEGCMRVNGYLLSAQSSPLKAYYGWPSGSV